METECPRFSSAERNELESLIRQVRSEDSPPASAFQPFDVEAQIRDLNEKITLFAGILLELDERISLLHEIAKLGQAKSELISRRVEALGRAINA